MAHLPIYRADRSRPHSRVSARRRLGLLLGALIALALVGSGLGRGFVFSAEMVGAAIVTAEPNLDRPGLITALRTALNVMMPAPVEPPPAVPPLEEVAVGPPEMAEQVAEPEADPADDAAEARSDQTEELSETVAVRPAMFRTYLASPAPSLTGATERSDAGQEAWQWLANESGRQPKTAPHLAKSSRSAEARSDLEPTSGSDAGQADQGRQDDDQSGSGDDSRVAKSNGDKGRRNDLENQVALGSDGKQQRDFADNQSANDGDQGHRDTPDKPPPSGSKDSKDSKDSSENRVARANEDKGPKGTADSSGGRGNDDKGSGGPTIVSRGPDDQGSKGNDNRGGKGGGDDKGGKGKH